MMAKSAKRMRGLNIYILMHFDKYAYDKNMDDFYIILILYVVL